MSLKYEPASAEIKAQVLGLARSVASQARAEPLQAAYTVAAVLITAVILGRCEERALLSSSVSVYLSSPTTLEATQGQIDGFFSPPIQMPPRRGGICGKLTKDFPSTRLQGGQSI